MSDSTNRSVARLASQLGHLVDPKPQPRTLRAIAQDIFDTWPKIYFGALPYVQAMASLDRLSDSYGYDSADSIVRYFLANAGTWRGEDARRIKAELKGMLKQS